MQQSRVLARLLTHAIIHYPPKTNLRCSAVSLRQLSYLFLVLMDSVVRQKKTNPCHQAYFLSSKYTQMLLRPGFRRDPHWRPYTTLPDPLAESRNCFVSVVGILTMTHIQNLRARNCRRNWLQDICNISFRSFDSLHYQLLTMTHIQNLRARNCRRNWLQDICNISFRSFDSRTSHRSSSHRQTVDLLLHCYKTAINSGPRM